MKKKLHKDTIATRAGIETDHQHGAIVPPLYLSTNFAFKEVGQEQPYEYSRQGNPTRDHLTQALSFCLLSHVLQQTYLLRVYEVIFRCMLFYIQAMLFYFFRYLYKHRGANQDYLVPHACLHILHVHDYVLFLTVLAFTILAVCMYFDTKQINNEHTTSKPPNPITDLEAELRAAKLATLES